MERNLQNFEALGLEILKMAEADQDMRRRAQANNGIIETEGVTKVDAIGWPDKSKVGEEVAHDAWLLVQHADHDVEFQKKCLELMKALPKGEAKPKDLAYLEDRVRVNENRPQLYGTQFHQDPKTGLHIPRPIEDLENLDQRRASIGLEPMKEYSKYWDDLNAKIKK